MAVPDRKSTQILRCGTDFASQFKVKIKFENMKKVSILEMKKTK